MDVAKPGLCSGEMSALARAGIVLGVWVSMWVFEERNRHVGGGNMGGWKGNCEVEGMWD